MAVFAQDIIVTNDSKKIEAKIVEVSKSEIKYKELDNLNGPTFVLETEEISSIIYSNGKVVLYNQSSETTPSAEGTTPSNAPVLDESTAEILFLSGQKILVRIIDMKSEYIIYEAEGKIQHALASDLNKVTLLKNGQVKQYNVSGTSTSPETVTVTDNENRKTAAAQNEGRIYRDNGHYLYNDTYISSKEIERILRKENGAAYKQWRKADGMLIGGAVCVGIGGGLVIGGLFPLIRGQYMTTLAIECSGLVPLGIGLGLTLGASSYYNKAIDIYNSKFDHAAVQFKWHVAPCSVGIALAF